MTPELDDDIMGPSTSHRDPQKPWLDEFHDYLDSREVVPEGTTTVQFWGVRLSTSYLSSF